MRVVALEEHYITQAFRDANVEHPLVRNIISEQLLRRLLDLSELRLASMDAAGIDVQVLSHTTPGPEGLEASVAARLAVEANDLAAEAIAAHPSRFVGLATLPTPDPDAAANELERTVSRMGFVGALVNGHVNGRYLDDRFFWPMFEAAQALGAPIYLHPAWPPQAAVSALYSGLSPAVDTALASGGWGWHIDTGLHVLRLVLSGLFDRFPRLQLIVGHLGEALPSMLWRAGRIMNGISGLERPLEEYFTQNISVTTSGVFDHAAFAAAVHALGVDRILFAADYPYSQNDQARSFLDGLPVSSLDREKIAHANAERLLGLTERAEARDAATPSS
jgi:predicted TIM-barrel fold metal-dependent hydrolase